MKLSKRLLLPASLILICFATISKAQAQEKKQTFGAVEFAAVVQILPNGELIIEFNGKQLRAITPEHIRQIELTENHAAALEKENALQADEIASLKRQTALEAKLDALNTQILSVKDDQLAQFRLLTKGQSDAIDKLNVIRGEQPTKSILDKLWVKGLIAGAGFASNVKSLYVSEPSPCVASPMPAPPKSAFSFKLTIRK